LKDFGQTTKPAKRVTGTVEITYSNYKINVGLSDQIFNEADSSKLRGGSRKETD